MMQQWRKPWFRIGLVWVLLCCGCSGGGAASAYYTLQPVNGIQNASQDQKAGQLVVGLGPVTVPQYLDRAAIVTRVSPNRLTVNNGHRWAGTLQSEIMRVLAADLGSRIHAREVVVFPWTGRVEPDLRFRVDIQAFEGRLGQNVTLKAAWTLTPARSEQPAVRRVSLIQEKANGYDFEDLAAAMGKALAGLSGEMAGTISQVSHQVSE